MKIAIFAATAIALTAACSSSDRAAQPASSITFGAGMTPGMSGHGAPATQAPPASATATASPARQGGTAVKITNFKFEPAMLTIPVGTTVTWTNQDEEPHTVAAKDGSFHSPGMEANGTYSFTFTTVGTYEYVCSIHPFMTGSVAVTK